MKFTESGQLMFGQVREDAAVELMLLREVSSPERAMIIASGGCTAFSLLAHSNCRIEAVDISGAQIALVELKARMFQQLGFEQGKKACCEDARSAYQMVEPNLSESARQLMETEVSQMRRGLNNVGSVDRQLAYMADLFQHSIHSRAQTERFLCLEETEEQERYYHRSWNNWQWKLALRVAFSKWFLSVSGFSGASQFVSSDFPQVMRARLERSLTAFPNATNPYIWQTFLQCYPSRDDGLPLYLQTSAAKSLIANLPKLVLYCRDLLGWFQEQESQSCDFFGLSNVLELLPEDYAEKVLSELLRCARRGAVVVTRSIFPRSGHTFKSQTTLFGSTLVFDEELSKRAEHDDRSQFCNFIQVFRVH